MEGDKQEDQAARDPRLSSFDDGVDRDQEKADIDASLK